MTVSEKCSELTEIISPAFTEETVLKILTTKSSLSEIKLLDIVIDNDKSKKGDSYLSSICRTKITASGKKASGELEELTVPVIVKFFPKNIARQKTFRSADFFRAEIYFYEKVWPEMKKIKLSKLPNEPDEVPLLLASFCDGKNDFIALEDLTYQRFKPSSRSETISIDTLLRFLKILANFHALGLAAKTQNPLFEERAKNLYESYFADKYRPWYEKWFYKSMGHQFKTAIKDLLPSEYYDKVTKLFSRDFYGEVIKCCHIDDKFTTVTQGDAWLPNFLAKYDDAGNQLGSVIIDFQLARFAPLTNDLFHFLCACVPLDLLSDEWDNLVGEYHKFLTSRIAALGGDKNLITLEELHEEIMRYSIFGLAMSMESFSMSLLTDDEVTDIDELKGENPVPIEDVWVFPEFDKARNEKMAKLVKHFVDKGFIS